MLLLEHQLVPARVQPVEDPGVEDVLGLEHLIDLSHDLYTRGVDLVVLD